MLRETHEKLMPVLKGRDHGFRWRGTDISRIEGLSDAVFAFAVTLLVVSLEAPKTFLDLQRMMHGFGAFAICFALLLMIWHSQYIYFRRYALDDKVSFLLNAALLFVVAFYVYPLKFLFTIFVDGITRHVEVDKAGQVITAMRNQDWRPLMMIYSAGFVGLYLIFALLYTHAYRLREELELNAMEAYETRGVVQENLVMMTVGVTAFLFAWMGQPNLAGLSYVLIGPVQTILGMVHGRRRRLLGVDPQLQAK